MSQTYIGIAVKSPGDVTPVTADFAAFLALTEDTIEDCDVIKKGSLNVVDCWFTLTDATAKVGDGGPDGTDNDLTLRIYTTSGDEYDRTIKVRNRNK